MNKKFHAEKNIKKRLVCNCDLVGRPCDDSSEEGSVDLNYESDDEVDRVRPACLFFLYFNIFLELLSIAELDIWDLCTFGRECVEASRSACRFRSHPER